MRDKWATSNAAPKRRRKRTKGEDQQRRRRLSSTTPAWGIGNGIASEEPIDDGNNDSGVSPDHYTSNSVSPTSGLSSSATNSSLSPSSSNYQDSNSMQSTPYDYSPRGMLNNCSSPLEFTQNHSMEQQQQAQPMNVPTAVLTNDAVPVNQDDLQCPICAHASENRLEFTEHLVTHCATKSNAQDFVRSILEQLTLFGSSPSQGSESEDMEEPGIRVPRINSQGKVKTFKCKQCPYVAITKLEFWNHSRIHIKEDKLLTCPKCPFVTEYKHHLEYHLRNHFGSKPFKCDKCAYSCVNKSMLNSHLKSHSNVYQYGCADCSYATKYCHSLKLHLRKYVHQPAMVLNADGSPNPLPIIDVYGTRRGPKQKSRKQNQNGNGHNPNMPSTSNYRPPVSSPSQSVSSPSLSPINHMNMLNGTASPPTNGFNTLSSSMNGMNMVSNSMDAVAGPSNAFNPVAGPSHAFSPVAGPSNAFNPVAGPSHAFNPVAGPSHAFNSVAGPSHAFNPVAGPSHAFNSTAGPSNAFNPVAGPSHAFNPTAGPSNAFNPTAGPSNGFNSVASHLNGFNPVAGPSNGFSPVAGPSNGFNVVVQNQPMLMFPYSQLLAMAQFASAQSYVNEMQADKRNLGSPTGYTDLSDNEMDVDELPQDLAVRSNGFPANAPQSNGLVSGSMLLKQNRNLQNGEIPLDLSKPSTSNNVRSKPVTSSPKATGTSRRKGKAVKLERRVFQRDTDDEDLDLDDLGIEEFQQQVQQTQRANTFPPPVASTSNNSNENDNAEHNFGAGNEFRCPFCEIVFGNVVMYTVHMGYHGYKDPYTCNMCGHQCSDELSFFMHIARSKHS